MNVTRGRTSRPCNCVYEMAIRVLNTLDALYKDIRCCMLKKYL